MSSWPRWSWKEVESGNEIVKIEKGAVLSVDGLLHPSLQFLQIYPGHARLRDDLSNLSGLEERKLRNYLLLYLKTLQAIELNQKGKDIGILCHQALHTPPRRMMTTEAVPRTGRTVEVLEEGSPIIAPNQGVEEQRVTVLPKPEGGTQSTANLLGKRTGHDLVKEKVPCESEV